MSRNLLAAVLIIMGIVSVSLVWIFGPGELHRVGYVIELLGAILAGIGIRLIFSGSKWTPSFLGGGVVIYMFGFLLFEPTIIALYSNPLSLGLLGALCIGIGLGLLRVRSSSLSLLLTTT